MTRSFPLIGGDSLTVNITYTYEISGKDVNYGWETYIPYERDRFAVYDFQYDDAMESIEIMVSESPIDPEFVKEGYHGVPGGLYYCIADEEKARKWFDERPSNLDPSIF